MEFWQYTESILIYNKLCSLLPNRTQFYRENLFLLMRFIDCGSDLKQRFSIPFSIHDTLNNEPQFCQDTSLYFNKDAYVSSFSINLLLNTTNTTFRNKVLKFLFFIFISLKVILLQ